MSAILLSLLVGVTSCLAERTVSVGVDTSRVIAHIPASFLSVTIDTGAIEKNFEGFDFSSPRVLNMAKGLTPALLRVGGGSADSITYVPSNPPASRSSPARPEERKELLLDRLGAGASGFTMNFSQWDKLNHFAEDVGWDFIFGLNALKRRSDGSWDPTNAELLINYTRQQGYAVAWELGNGENYF